KGLLYAGTESGMYVSFDDGASWRSFQLNLPIVPVTDLAIKDDDLVVATQGRSFWVLDDLTPLHQLRSEQAKSALHLFAPRPAYRLPGGGRPGGGPASRTEGENAPAGVVLRYHLRAVPPKGTPVSLEFLESGGKRIRRFSTSAEQPAQKLEVKSG